MPLIQTMPLDVELLRALTLGDRDLMREILSALIEDTSRKAALLAASVRERDKQKCARLARAAANACANVGAESAAEALREIERRTASARFSRCGETLVTLRREIDRLRKEALAL